MWNEAFSKLGKFDLEDKNFDKQAYIKIRKKVEGMEGKSKSEAEGELDEEIGMQELEGALWKARNGKAAGDDGCVNEILKQGGEYMKLSLLTLFRRMWREERVTSEWARGPIDWEKAPARVTATFLSLEVQCPY